MKTPLHYLFLLFTTLALGQTKISGKVVDHKNKPLKGANVFIEGSYDGMLTDENGSFLFETLEKGAKVLVVGLVNYETIKMPIIIEKFEPKTYFLKESINTLDAVIINAGTFEAGGKNRVSILKPLDILTTAGSNANIVAAFQTLPGTQTVGEDGRLYVRGGEADETQTFVDGIRVGQPYASSVQNLPTRGRFSPTLFSGMSFSTGGYSAEYGEALSSVLLLNTKEEEAEEKTEISVMTVGLGLANTQKWGKNSLSVNTAYTNLAPYQVVVPQNVDWNKPFQSASGEAVFRHKFTNGMFKFYAAFDDSHFGLNQESINSPSKIKVNLNNNNFYLNSSYKGFFGDGWQITSGLGYGLGHNKISLDWDGINNAEHSAQLKLKVKKSFSDQVKWSFGADYFLTKFDEHINFADGSRFGSGYQAGIAALYSEADLFFSSKFAAKLGLRASNNNLLKENAFSPRISLAYKINKKGQFSLAYGNFSQAPRQDYLKYADYLQSEKANHYILNYQYSKDKQTLRAEFYVKKYFNLIKFNTDFPQYYSIFNNEGKGYAQGLDIFWRDGKSIKNLEYWVSYSYIDSKRDYKNYSAEVTPNFVAKNSLSLVGKYWINSLKSQLSLTNTYASGRPFNNPNETVFMNGKTKSYNNLSMGWAYLLTTQKILYFSMTNVLGTKNIFGYEYANQLDMNNIYQSRAITPTADRFIFLGFFWTISDNKKENQLNNL